jgi:hypothetical protein
MSNNVKIALAIVVLAVAGYFIYSAMSDGTESRPEDKIMRTNQTDEPVVLDSKKIDFEIIDEMAHYGQ